MKNRVHIGVFICLLWATVSNCVDTFDARLPESSTGLLVIEGNIISDSTVVFSLSRSFALDVEGIPQDYNQVDAEVSVVGSDGSCFSGVSLGYGKYQVAVGTLDKNVSYSLKIVYDGDTYTSEPQYPLETEAIDNITYEQSEEYGDIYIRVSTQSKGAAYYFWSYEEDWEVNSVYKTLYIYNPDTDEIIEYETAPYAHGWCHNESSEIIVGTTESNEANCLEDKRLYPIVASDYRVSCYYSTLVKQRKISKGEYEYYQEKVKINEEMGGLFTPQPSELPTNITCNNPDKRTIGYVGVNLNVTGYRIFISVNDIQYKILDDRCQVLGQSVSGEYSFYELSQMGYAIAYHDQFGWHWAVKGCTDVRYLGATLEKPSFWPDETN